MGENKEKNWEMAVLICTILELPKIWGGGGGEEEGVCQTGAKQKKEKNK